MELATAAAPATSTRASRYGNVRDAIETGDILLFRGNAWLSRFIRWGSKSPYSHAGMAAWWDGRLVVLQAVGRGIEVVPVSHAVDAYHGQVDWFRIRPDAAAKLNRETLLDTAITELGTPYNTRGLFGLAFKMLTKRFRKTPDPKADPEAMFCSQYVSYCFRVAGLDLCPDIADACTSPGAFAHSPCLELAAILHR